MIGGEKGVREEEVPPSPPRGERRGRAGDEISPNVARLRGQEAAVEGDGAWTAEGAAVKYGRAPRDEGEALRCAKKAKIGLGPSSRASTYHITIYIYMLTSIYMATWLRGYVATWLHLQLHPHLRNHQHRHQHQHQHQHQHVAFPS